jgi:hypothetical protein
VKIRRDRRQVYCPSCEFPVLCSFGRMDVLRTVRRRAGAPSAEQDLKRAVRNRQFRRTTELRQLIRRRRRRTDFCNSLGAVFRFPRFSVPDREPKTRSDAGSSTCAPCRSTVRSPPGRAAPDARKFVGVPGDRNADVRRKCWPAASPRSHISVVGNDSRRSDSPTCAP